jgi:hypothetical protein
MPKREKGELFMDTATDQRPNEKKTAPLLCLCCARAMDTATPYPQLCALCRKDAHGSLIIVSTEVDELETAWRDALRASLVETQERFVAMMEAASFAYGPGSAMKRRDAIKRFNVRLDGSIAKGGEFAKLATMWRRWNKRSADRDIIAMMLTFAGEKVER